MPDVQFDENTITPSFKSRTILGDHHTPKMIELAMRIFKIKDEKIANMIVFIIAAIIFIISIIIFKNTLSGPTPGPAVVNEAAPEELKGLVQMNSNKRTKRNKGFTLIELLVAIAIVSILSSVVLASVSSARVKAQNGALVAQRHQVQLAMQLYYADNGSYPSLRTAGGAPIGNLINIGTNYSFYAVCVGKITGDASTDCYYSDQAITVPLADASTLNQNLNVANVLSTYVNPGRISNKSYTIAGRKYQGIIYVCNAYYSSGVSCNDNTAFILMPLTGGQSVCGSNSTYIILDGATTVCAQTVKDGGSKTNNYLIY